MSGVPRYGLAIGDGETRVEMGETDLWTYVVSNITGLGLTEKMKNTRPRPREDGEYVGKERRRGRKLTISGYVNTYSVGAASAAWQRLLAAWDAPDVRGVPGEFMPLEITLYGGDTVVVWGRPDQIDPVDDADRESGCIPFVATFDCVDALFYGPEQSVTVPLNVAAASGITWPVRWPLRWTSRTSSDRPAGQVTIGGTAAAWLQATIFAPGGLVRPVIEIENQFVLELDLTLPPSTSTRFVSVIASPWARSVLLDGVTDVAYALTPKSGLLKYARLPPGPQQAILRGADDTNSAWMNFSWRDAAQAI